jgi:hypothetical protein
MADANNLTTNEFLSQVDLIKDIPGFGGEFRIVKDASTMQKASGALLKLKLRVECASSVG